jgi:chitodextrinase
MPLERSSTAKRARGRIGQRPLVAIAIAALLLAIFTVGNVGQSTSASLRDTTTGDIATVQAASIKAVHTVDSTRNKNFSAGNLTNIDAVTVSNTGTIDAAFTTSTAITASAGSSASTLAGSITVALWQAATASGCTTPVNAVSGRWGDAALKTSGQLGPGASVLICVQTTVSNLAALTSDTTLATSVNTMLSRSSWTSAATSAIVQKYYDENPKAPAELKATNTTGASTTLTWAAASDDIAVTGYDIYSKLGTAAAIKLGTTTGLSYVVPNLVSDTTYTFTVVARDGAGHSSPAATLAVATADVTPPSPAPVLSGSLAGSTAALRWTAANDKNGIKEYQIYLGTEKISTVAGSTLSYETPALVAGTAYEYTVRAVDPSGNTTPSNAVSLALPPTLLDCTNSGLTAAALTWSKPAGNVARTYEVVVNNQVVYVTTSSATALEYVLTRDKLDSVGVRANGTYTAYVRLQGQPVPLYQRTVVLESLWYLFFVPAVRCS